MPAQLIDTKTAAALLNVHPRTLETWRSSQRYPLKFVKVGRLAKYRISDLEAFIESRVKGGIK